MCIRDRIVAIVANKTPILSLSKRKLNLLIPGKSGFPKIPKTKNAPITVSYTHLDVYKRQGLNSYTCDEYLEKTF